MGTGVSVAGPRLMSTRPQEVRTWHLMHELYRADNVAMAPDDHQWIHVDPDRAAGGPFGGTIAHGLLTLSLLPPVWVGEKVRARSEIAKVAKVDRAVQATLVTAIEVEGSEKPAAIIESIVRHVD